MGGQSVGVGLRGGVVMFDEHQVGEQTAEEEENTSQLWSLHPDSFCVELLELWTRVNAKNWAFNRQ